MKTEIKAYRITLRREDIGKVIIAAAIDSERDLTSPVVQSWIEELVPTKLTVVVVPAAPKKN